MKTRTRTAWIVGVAAMGALGAGGALAADPATIDWTKVPASKLTLFYPGQASYEWVRNDHKGGKGAKAAAGGQACEKCHEGEEKDLGAAIVKGGKLEPMPVKGKNGSVDLAVQAAYDAKNAYLRFEWKTLNPYAGTEHQYLRYDGKEWKVHGFPKLDKVVQDGVEPGIYEDRLTIMLDDGKVADFARQGCWLTCHDGQRDMAKQFTKEQVAGNALLTLNGAWHKVRDDATLLEDHDAVGAFDGGQTVRNDHGRAPAHQRLERRLYLAFGFGIQRGGCFVEKEKRGVLE